MNFCTAVNCIDGRVQLPVIEYLQKRFKVSYVDSITEPGPNLILAEQVNKNIVRSIFNRICISIEKHNSIGIAVVGHYDCAGNPAPRDKQDIHTIKAMQTIKYKFKDVEIIGLWVDENLDVVEVVEM